MSKQYFLWPFVEAVPPLSDLQVHVWAWQLAPAPLPSHWEILSDEEVLRARRFVFPQDRDRYVRAHAGMRTLLALYTGNTPSSLAFGVNTYGKPHLLHGGTERSVHFNLSHSAGIAALAVSRSYDLGIDIEHVLPIEAGIAEDHFSPRELRTLQRLSPAHWLRGFYRCWTGKEALLKGEGFGLNVPLDQFDVESDPDLPPALLDVRPQARIAQGWRLAALAPAFDIIGTLAVQDTAGTFHAETSLQCFVLSA